MTPQKIKTLLKEIHLKRSWSSLIFLFKFIKSWAMPCLSQFFVFQSTWLLNAYIPKPYLNKKTREWNTVVEESIRKPKLILKISFAWVRGKDNGPLGMAIQKEFDAWQSICHLEHEEKKPMPTMKQRNKKTMTSRSFSWQKLIQKLTPFCLNRKLFNYYYVNFLFTSSVDFFHRFIRFGLACYCARFNVWKLYSFSNIKVNQIWIFLFP